MSENFHNKHEKFITEKNFMTQFINTRYYFIQKKVTALVSVPCKVWLVRMKNIIFVSYRILLLIKVIKMKYECDKSNLLSA